jgi:hypothetical protein
LTLFLLKEYINQQFATGRSQGDSGRFRVTVFGVFCPFDVEVFSMKGQSLRMLFDERAALNVLHEVCAHEIYSRLCAKVVAFVYGVD